MKISEILREEHELIHRFLDILSITAKEMERDAKFPHEDLKNITAFFRDFFVDYHQRKEEELLFGVLEEHGVFRETLPIEEMLHDHRKINVLLLQIENLSTSSESESQRKILAQSIYKFINALQCHSHREDRVLYPMGDRLINGNDMKKLVDAFKKEKRQNCEMVGKYLEMVEKMESKRNREAVPNFSLPQLPQIPTPCKKHCQTELFNRLFQVVHNIIPAIRRQFEYG